MLCGNNGEACWAKYGSYPLHRAYCHEQALRILLASIESHANRYRRHIVPVWPRPSAIGDSADSCQSESWFRCAAWAEGLKAVRACQVLCMRVCPLLSSKSPDAPWHCYTSGQAATALRTARACQAARPAYVPDSTTCTHTSVWDCSGRQACLCGVEAAQACVRRCCP